MQQPGDSPQFDALNNAFHDLLQNQQRLEQRVAHLEKILRVRTETADSEPAVQEPVPVPLLEPKPEHTQPQEPGLESKLGLTLVNRIGAITLILGVAFFFKWAVDNNWIGPAGRVILGLLAGFATLAAADFLWRKRQQIFAQGITATGIAIIYLALYAAFDFYQLIPQSAAFLLMVSTTVMAAVLALRYRSIAIAALGLSAAYITPLLLSTVVDHPWFLFSYLVLLNFAATELGKRGSWPRLELISFVATALIYGAWLFDRGILPEKRLVATLAPLALTAQRWGTQTPLLFALSQLLTALAVAFVWYPAEAAFLPLALLIAAAGLAFAHFHQYRLALVGAFCGFWFSYPLHLFDPHPPLVIFFGISCGFILFLAWSWWHLVWERSPSSTVALAVFALSGILYYALSYNQLHVIHRPWCGPLAALVAAVYLAFGLFLHQQYKDSADDKRLVFLALGVALTFLTLAIPIQFKGFTITIEWAVEAATLTWIGFRLQSERAIRAALVVFVLVAIRLLGVEAITLPDPLSYSLLWNSRFYTFAVSAAGMLFAAYWTSGILLPAALATYFAGHTFLLWGLCMEVLGWAARSASPANLLSVETVAITILFAVYAVTLVSLGVATATALNRLTGLGLIGLVILKLYFFDVWQLARPYQIAAFVILGILLLSTSFLYSHFRRLIETWWKDEKTSA